MILGEKTILRAVEKTDVMKIKMLHKIFMAYCSTMKNSPKIDFLLDHVIIESIDKIKELELIN